MQFRLCGVRLAKTGMLVNIAGGWSGLQRSRVDGAGNERYWREITAPGPTRCAPYEFFINRYPCIKSSRSCPPLVPDITSDRDRRANIQETTDRTTDSLVI